MFPYGGYLRWEYNQYQGPRYQYEILNRYPSKAGSTETKYPIYRDTSGDTGRAVHAWGDLHEQDLDGYGNVTAQRLYDWNTSSNPLRTYTNTYVIDSNYTSAYIRNR